MSDDVVLMKKEKFFKCTFPNCEMIFIKKCVLRDHIRAHKQEKPYKCGVCAKMFTQMGNLKIHEKSHKNSEGYICTYPDCKKSFVTNSYLKVHMKSHYGIKECICTFENCGKKFSHRGNLKYHENKAHPELKNKYPYSCSHSKCNRKFTTLEEKLAHHYEIEHSCKEEKMELLNLLGELKNCIIKYGEKDPTVIENFVSDYNEAMQSLKGKETFRSFI